VFGNWYNLVFERRELNGHTGTGKFGGELFLRKTVEFSHPLGEVVPVSVATVVIAEPFWFMEYDEYLVLIDVYMQHRMREQVRVLFRHVPDGIRQQAVPHNPAACVIDESLAQHHDEFYEGLWCEYLRGNAVVFVEVSILGRHPYDSTTLSHLLLL
jgi:hypothetical protein